MRPTGLHRRAVLAALATAPIASPGATQPAEGGDPQAILTAVDRVRVPQIPFRMTVTLTDYIDNKQHDQITLTVYSKLDPQTHEFRTLVKYVQPPRDVGKVVLFNGTNLWFFDPASKATVRISPQQRLIGQAANGDVVTTNLGVDYSATIAGRESVLDADKTTRDCWQLDLKPARPTAVYGHIELWVERATSRPVKGRFFTDSGHLLKVAYYRGYQPALGATRPMEMIIIDAIDAKAVTIMSSSGYTPQSIPDSWFQRDYLSEIR